jgi:hypothetical protein
VAQSQTPKQRVTFGIDSSPTVYIPSRWWRPSKQLTQEVILFREWVAARRSTFKERMDVRRRNGELLDRAADEVLEEYKAVPYATLLDPRWPAATQKIEDGVPLLECRNTEYAS